LINWFVSKSTVKKIKNIHFNPVFVKWQFAKDTNDYHFSSPKFYKRDINNFDLFKNIFNLFVAIKEKAS